jgi:adenylate cyclase
MKTSLSSSLVKKWRKSAACAVGVLIVILVFGVFPVGRALIEKADRGIGDWILRSSGGPPEKKELVMLGIDETSLSLDVLDPVEIETSPGLTLMSQRFPWDRRVWSLAIERLADAGAKLIILDLIFSQESDPEADAALAAVIQRYPGRVVLVSTFSEGGAQDSGGVYHIVEPFEQLLNGEVLPRIGYSNFKPDPLDGLVRQARYTTTLGFENDGVRSIGETEYRSLAAEVIHAMGLEVPQGDQLLRLAGRSDTGGSEVYAPRSLYSIFAEQEWKANYQNGEFFRDKVVMIGPVAPRFHDVHNTPMGPITGPQLHLQAIACGMEKAFVRPILGHWWGMILLGAVAIVWTALVSRPLLSVFGLMGIIVGVAGLVIWLGAAHSLQIPLTGALLSLGGGWLVAQSYEIVTERLEKGRLRRDFRRFVSRDVADAMIDQQDAWHVTAAGVKRRVVVLFSDVRGFTERSEQTDPGDLVKQLNEYLTSMVEVIFRHGGTLDKFIGDAVMAHWGALGGGNEADHSRQAILAGREMIEVLGRLNATWKAAGKAPFQIGVGLHLGEAVAGEIGSPDRTEFGVIGDTVNLASRLEGLTKAFHCEVIYSDEVREASGIHDGAMDLGQVRVKGRKNPVRLYGIGDEDAVREHLKSFERDEEGVIVMSVK